MSIIEVRKCIGCSIEFIPNTRKQRNCSRSCRTSRQRKTKYGAVHPVIKCRECDETFYRKSINHKYCSPYCKAKGVAKDFGTPYATLKTQNYRSRTPEFFIRGILTKGKKRSKLSAEDVLSLYYKQGGKCALSGIPMTHILGKGRVPTNISIDRIKVGGEYVKDNVRLVCSIINVMRYTQDDDAFIGMCRAVVEKHDNNFDDYSVRCVAA